MKLVISHAVGVAIVLALSPWLALWAAIALLAAWTLAVTAAARPDLRARMGGVAVALLLLAVVTAAPVVARAL